LSGLIAAGLFGNIGIKVFYNNVLIDLFKGDQDEQGDSVTTSSNHPQHQQTPTPTCLTSRTSSHATLTGQPPSNEHDDVDHCFFRVSTLTTLRDPP
jgi:hypothetical protein